MKKSNVEWRGEARKRNGKWKRLVAGTLCASLTVTALSGLSFAQAVQTKTQGVTLADPRIVPDGSMDAGQKVTWDCVWFGNYPQAEVVPASEEYTALSEELIQTGDLIQDDVLYRTLQSTAGWDEHGDLVVDDEKYKRIKKEDAVYNESDYHWKNSTEYHYFKYQPIKWRVLSVDGSEALLLADKALDNKQYHTENEKVTWEGCTMRSWLNGYGASANIQNQDYGSNNYINTAFDTSEQSAIKETAIKNKDSLEHGTDGGNRDKVSLLSRSGTYGGVAERHGFISHQYTSDEAKRAQSTVYAKAMGTYTYNSSSDYDGNCFWWLRSLGYHSSASHVYPNGWIDWEDVSVSIRFFAVRPTLNLNLNVPSDTSSPSLWSYAGTVCSDGNVKEVGGDVPSNPSTPSVTPTASPSVVPTLFPVPTTSPMAEPTVAPTVSPTVKPTVVPTSSPTVKPTVVPTSNPTVKPTITPTLSPTVKPTITPTVSPTAHPSDTPTVLPTPTVTETPSPSVVPASPTPTQEATRMPSATPSPSVKPRPPVRPDDEEEGDKISPAKKLKRGSKVTDKKTKAIYKITKTGKNRAVEYVKSTRKKPANITVPASVKLKGNAYKVTSVGKAAFKNKKLKTVKIGKNVKTIGRQAFSGCTKLTNVTLGRNVTTIEVDAFKKCTALTIITIPSKVTKIRKKAFYQCKNLRYILVKARNLTAKNVGNNAFGKGAAQPRVKMDKDKWKQYAHIFLSKGMSKKAVFITDPVKLVI